MRISDWSSDVCSSDLTIAAELTGASQLVKTDLGTLVLSGANSYTGGTAINAGTLSISSDGNLGDAAGGITFEGGTLNITADMTSVRAVTFVGAGTILTAEGTTFSLGGMLGGTGRSEERRVGKECVRTGRS